MAQDDQSAVATLSESTDPSSTKVDKSMKSAEKDPVSTTQDGDGGIKDPPTTKTESSLSVLCRDGDGGVKDPPSPKTPASLSVRCRDGDGGVKDPPAPKTPQSRSAQ